MKYGIDQRETDEIMQLVNCTNPTEKCPDCPRWKKDCDGLDEYEPDVDCGWR